MIGHLRPFFARRESRPSGNTTFNPFPTGGLRIHRLNLFKQPYDFVGRTGSETYLMFPKQWRSFLINELRGWCKSLSAERRYG